MEQKWSWYLIADLKTWSDNAESRSPLEHFDSFETMKARFMELRSQPYNSEIALNPNGFPYARLTVGIERKNGMSALDILQVRNGQNYLVDDFTRMEKPRDDPEVMSMLSRVANEIGFDRVRPYAKTAEGTWRAMPDMPFSKWDNKYFPVERSTGSVREVDPMER